LVLRETADIHKGRHAVAVHGDDAVPKDVLDRILAMVPVKMQNKVGLALKKNTRVILVKNPETHEILDIAKQFDKAKRLINGDAAANPSASSKSAGAMAQFEAAMKSLDNAVRNVCLVAGMQYFSPASLPSAQSKTGVSLVEVMRAGTMEWRMQNVYRAAVRFLVVAEALDAVMDALPESTRESAKKAVEDIRGAVSAVAEEE